MILLAFNWKAPHKKKASDKMCSICTLDPIHTGTEPRVILTGGNFTFTFNFVDLTEPRSHGHFANN